MSSTSTPAPTAGTARLQGFAFFAVIAGLMLTLFLEALDQAIVGTAMPRIVAQLHGLDRYSWVVTTYILASVTMIPIVGKLSDQFGRKGFLLFGTILFLLGSILAGASQDMNQLIIFRGLQGLGAGIGMALVFTVMADWMTVEERAKWSGLFGAVYGVSSLFGPTLGGWLAEHGPLLGSLVTEESRWRWVFYINLPIGLIAILSIIFFLPARAANRTYSWAGWSSLRQIDFLGAILCMAATVSVMLGLTWGGDQIYAWTSLQVAGILATGVILLALFLFVEYKAKEPILPLSLFRDQIFSAGSLLSLLQMMMVLGFSLYLPLFFQGVKAISPTSAGLIMTPLSLSMVAGAMLSSLAITKLKRYQIVAIVGASLMSVGSLLIALMSPATAIWQAIVFMIVVGFGVGTFFTLPNIVVQNILPDNQLGAGTAALRYLGQVGASLGIAIVGTVVTSGSSGNLMSNFPTTSAAQQGLATALSHGFFAVLVFALIALIATFFLKEIPLKSTLAEEKKEEELSEQTSPEEELAVTH